MKAENPVLEHIFSYISGSTEPIVSKNKRIHPRADPPQLHKFDENLFKTAT